MSKVNSTLNDFHVGSSTSAEKSPSQAIQKQIFDSSSKEGLPPLQEHLTRKHPQQSVRPAARVPQLMAKSTKMRQVLAQASRKPSMLPGIPATTPHSSTMTPCMPYVVPRMPPIIQPIVRPRMPKLVPLQLNDLNDLQRRLSSQLGTQMANLKASLLHSNEIQTSKVINAVKDLKTCSPEDSVERKEGSFVNVSNADTPKSGTTGEQLLNMGRKRTSPSKVQAPNKRTKFTTKPALGMVYPIVGDADDSSLFIKVCDGGKVSLHEDPDGEPFITLSEAQASALAIVIGVIYK